MGAIRTLYTDLVLRADKAVKGLKVYDRLWKGVAKSVETSATIIEKAAERSISAMARISEGASTLRAVSTEARTARAPSSGTGGGGGRPRAAKPGKDPLDKAIRSANIGEAARAGMAAGATAVNDATAALGKLSTKADTAKANIADLTAQVERNRREMAELKKKTIETGDADGTLAARSKGLAVATAQTSIELSKARRALSEVRGGLIDNIKAAANLSQRFTVMKVAAGNMAANAATSIAHGIGGAFVGAGEKAIKFESALADVAKVVDGLKTPTGEVTAEYTAMESKILDLSKTIAGPGAEGFAKIYAAAGEAGIAKQDLDQFAESAAKVSVAFGVTAEEAGSGMAKMRSGLGLSQNEVESLAGTMNYLSNNMAVTASQAMEVVLKTGGVGKAANVSGQEVAGLGAAMIAAGAQSDVAATASKNYILSMASGVTATKAQRSAFKSLGMDAEEVARQFTGSAEQRLKVQQELLTKIGKLSEDKRVSVLSNLFGKESLGAISGITGDVDKFTKSMTMATDSVAAASSVQNEYNVRSKTTENAVALLKSNIEALAIKFGQALLPYINEIVAFLTSPEGQDWGAKAVEKAVTVVTGLADALGFIGGIISGLIDTFGGLGVAVGGVGLAIAGLAGPWGIMAAAAGVAIVGITTKIGDLLERIPMVGAAVQDLRDILNFGATKAFEEGLRKRDAKIRDEEDDARNAAEARPTRSYGYGAAPMAAPPPGFTDEQIRERMAAADKRGLFNELSAKVRRGEKLKPSEALEYTALSKSLDEAKASKAKKGRTHKQTKQDKQLAAMDPSLRGILTRGGEEDSGGDAMVAKNALDKAVFGAATGGKGGRGGIDGLGGMGPGPNITNENHYYNVTTTITQDIDARGPDSAASNLGAAAYSMGNEAGGVVWKGLEKVLSGRNGGGAMRPA